MELQPCRSGGCAGFLQWGEMSCAGRPGDKCVDPCALIVLVGVLVAGLAG